MRAIHIVPAIAEEASGPSYAVDRLCESLIGTGQEVTLAALDWAPMASPPAFLRTFSLGLGPRRLGRSPAMRRWLDLLVREGAVDLLHNHGLWMMPNVYPGQAAVQRGMPLVVSPRGTMSQWAMQSGSVVKKFFWPLLQRPALVATACFHATAMSEYEDIRRMGFRQPVAVLPNGIDMPVLRVKYAGSLQTLLFLGRVHPVKGLDMLLPAWGAVQDRFPDWRLQIAGPDSRGYLARMKALAGELGLKRIEFLGPVYGEQKWQAYRDADLFILPTHSENFGMAVAEALASGTPAIVTKGAPWAGLEAHDAGWWIDIGVDPLASCLETALSCSFETLVEKGRRGREWMQREFSWRHIGRCMAETYHWVLQGGKRPEWVIED